MVWGRFWRDRAGRAELVGGQLAAALGRLLDALDGSVPTAHYDEQTAALATWAALPPRPRFRSLRVDQWAERGANLERAADGLATALLMALGRFPGFVAPSVAAAAEHALTGQRTIAARRLEPLPTGPTLAGTF